MMAMGLPETGYLRWTQNYWVRKMISKCSSLQRNNTRESLGCWYFFCYSKLRFYMDGNPSLSVDIPYIYIYILVGGWPTPLKNMKVSWYDYSQSMESHKSHVPHQPVDDKHVINHVSKMGSTSNDEFLTPVSYDPCYVSPPDGPGPSHAVPPGPHQASLRIAMDGAGESIQNWKGFGNDLYI